MLTEEQEVILADITGKSREFIIAHPEFKLSAAQKQRFELAKKQLARGIPLAYILGYRWFFGNKFTVNKNVLIPRPETETLVEIALERARKLNPDVIADIGTGSGAIIVSLAKTLKDRRKQFSKTRLIATDISEKALQVAKQNRRKLNAPIKFHKGNLAQPLIKTLWDKKVLIVANLPYLSAKQLKEPTIKYEPKLALYGGKQSHQKIAQLIKQLAKINFQSATVLLEIDPSQVNAIKKLTKKYLEDFQDIKIHRDLNSRERIVEIIF